MLDPLTLDLPRPCLADAQQHIALLTGTAETAMHMRLIRKADKEARALLPGAVALRWAEIEEAQAAGFDVFIVVNGGGVTNAEIEYIRALFIDADDVPVPETWHAEPDFMVQRDPTHWHAYWVISRIEPADFGNAQKRLAAFYGTDRTIHDPARLMRLAGSVHQKDPAHPQLVRLVPMRAATREPWELDRPAADILAGVPDLPPEPEHAAAPTGEPVTLAQLRDMLSWIDPTFSGGDGTWTGITLAVRHEQLPVVAQHAGEGLAVGWGEQLADDWCSGSLWRERTGDTGFAVLTYQGPDELLARLGERARDTGKMIGIGTVYALAKAVGYMGTPRAPILPTERFAAALPKLAAALPLAAVTTNQADRTGEDDGPIPSDVLRSRPVAPVRELIRGLIERGCTTLLSGVADTYKSTLGLQWGLCIAAGVPVWGRPVEQANFLHLSWEDDADEIARRVQRIATMLKLPPTPRAYIWDLRSHGLGALYRVDGIDPQPAPLPFLARLRTFLASLPGHTFIVADSAYNALSFAPDVRINEDAVNGAIQALDRFCAECDATFLPLYHPSRRGARDGDAGNSTAWDSAPRARLAIKREAEADSVTLSVAKRSHGPRDEPTPLRYVGGALRPVTTGERTRLGDAVIEVALIGAGDIGTPILSRGAVPGWAMKMLARKVGRPVTDREVREALEDAVASEPPRLRYQTRKRGTHGGAGYFPPITTNAEAAEVLKAGGDV